MCKQSHRRALLPSSLFHPAELIDSFLSPELLFSLVSIMISPLATGGKVICCVLCNFLTFPLSLSRPLFFLAAPPQTSEPSPPLADQPPEQEEADDYSPILKRARHSNGPAPPSPPLLPRDSSPTNNNHDRTRHNGEQEPWLRPVSPARGNDLTRDDPQGRDKYEQHGGGGGKFGDNNNADKSLLSQALERREEDSASDTTGSERPESASMDKSELGSRDGDVTPNPLFPPGLEALYRQAGFSPFLGLGGPPGPNPPSSMAMPPLPGPSTTHIGLQSHAANPTSKLDSSV